MECSPAERTVGEDMTLGFTGLELEAFTMTLDLLRNLVRVNFRLPMTVALIQRCCRWACCSG